MIDKVDKKELAKLKEEYLKYGTIYKLELLGDDNSFFRNYIIDGIDYPDEALSPSQRRIKKAKIFFKIKLKEIEKLDNNNFESFLIEFLEKIGNLEIIQYPVENDADAARIFETVNDRGKQLTNLEKTKSFLMQMVYLTTPEESGDLIPHLKQINESFSRIFRDFEKIKNSEKEKNVSEDDIQRYHFVYYESSEVRKSYEYLDLLKKKIRSLYRENKNSCLKYILDYTSDLEKAFFALKEIISYDKSDIIGIQLKKIYALGVVANFYPLLIAFWIEEKNEKKIQNLLIWIEIFSFRVYGIGRRRSDRGMGTLYSLASDVYNEKISQIELIKEIIKMILDYQNDKEFKINLNIENFYERLSTSDIKYLLFEYEIFLREQMKEPLEINLNDILSEKFEIEHIWARDPSKLKLKKSLYEIHDKYKDRLGNLTLASGSWNSKWRNGSFLEKKKEYKDSCLRVQRELSRYRDWGQAQIEKREEQLLKFIFIRWPVWHPCPYKECSGIVESGITKCPECNKNIIWKTIKK